MAVSGTVTVAAPVPAPGPGMWTTLLRFSRKKPLGAAGGVIMLLILFTAVFANVLQTHDPIATNAADTLARPSSLPRRGGRGRTSPP